MDKLITQFELFLKTQQVSPASVKNYAVDLRNFFEWFILHLKTLQVKFDENNLSTAIELITKEKIELYKDFLSNNNTPVKTINRRLSTLRKFGTFAISQGWLQVNPAKTVPNFGTKPKSEPDFSERIVAEFKNDLLKEGINPVTIKNYANDVSQFLNYLGRIQR